MNKLIPHIPHSSNNVPVPEGSLVSKAELDKEISKLTDWHTEDLFASPNDISVVAEFSRIFCDPERFVNDEEEVMAKYGMGVLYETADDGRVMQKVSPELRERIIREYYEPNHAKFSQTVQSQLGQHGKTLIVDCHSFCDIPFERDLDKSPNRPDICIGTDNYHTPEKLRDFTVRYYQNKGLSMTLNTPYSGTIVPLVYYGVDSRVLSIMVEINRKLYLVEGTNRKSANYDSIKSVIQGYLAELRYR